MQFVIIDTWQLKIMPSCPTWVWNISSYRQLKEAVVRGLPVSQHSRERIPSFTASRRTLMTIDLFTSTDTDINNVKQRTSFQSWVHVRPVISSLDMSISVSVSLPFLPPCVCFSYFQVSIVCAEKATLLKNTTAFCCILTYLINILTYYLNYKLWNTPLTNGMLKCVRNETVPLVGKRAISVAFVCPSVYMFVRRVHSE